MANLSIKELSKRNNFNVFVRRIRTGQGFYIAGQDELVLLDPLILDKINDIYDLTYFKNKNSIALPIINGSNIKLTSLYKDSEFSDRTQNTTQKQTTQINNIAKKLEDIKQETNKNYVNIRVADAVHQVTEIKETTFGTKADFYFIDIHGNNVLFISHKDGNSPKDFQQWSGTSKRFQEIIFNHPETQNFIESIKSFGNELPRATTVVRKIKDDLLKQLAVYGNDLGFNFGLNNVQAVLQGDLYLKNIGDAYILKASHYTMINPEVPTQNYEPAFMAVHKKDRSDHGIKNARITINPLGGRKINAFI